MSFLVIERSMMPRQHSTFEDSIRRARGRAVHVTPNLKTKVHLEYFRALKLKIFTLIGQFD